MRLIHVLQILLVLVLGPASNVYVQAKGGGGGSGGGGSGGGSSGGTSGTGDGGATGDAGTGTNSGTSSPAKVRMWTAGAVVIVY